MNTSTKGCRAYVKKKKKKLLCQTHTAMVVSLRFPRCCVTQMNAAGVFHPSSNLTHCEPIQVHCSLSMSITQTDWKQVFLSESQQKEAWGKKKHRCLLGKETKQSRKLGQIAKKKNPTKKKEERGGESSTVGRQWVIKSRQEVCDVKVRSGVK